MSQNIEEYDITSWVSDIDDENQKEFRQAVHTILIAIAKNDELKASMIIKGGILLAVRYHSPRFTTDIDFSTNDNLDEAYRNKIYESLNTSLKKVVESLDYGLDCQVQSCRIQPTNIQNPTFPELKITIGYAYKGSDKHQRLIAGQSPDIVSIDFSFNEVINKIEHITLDNNCQIQAYSITDVVSEKYRSVLQQKVRNRNRRQDVYDLFLILNSIKTFNVEEKKLILTSLISKSENKGISPNRHSLRDEETIKRAKHEYSSLEFEINEELPEFDNSYSTVREFYESLPWNN